ncbi:MAG: ComEC/Rec2 family competence protein, partial [Pirellulales bacterium]
MNELRHRVARDTTYRPLVVVLAAACGGVVLDRYAAWPAMLWWLVALVAWIGWLLVWRRGRTAWAVAPLVLSVAATGAAWHHCRWSLFEDDNIGFAAPTEPGPAAIEARATSGPRRLPAPPPDALRPIAISERTRLEIEVLAIRDGSTWRPASGRTSVVVGGNIIDVRPGERLRIFGQLGVLPTPANPGEFDFAALARATRRLCWLRCEFPECIGRLGGGWSFNPRDLIDALRTRGDAL